MAKIVKAVRRSDTGGGAKRASNGDGDGLAGRLHELDETFLACRDLRHPWKVLGMFHMGLSIVRQLKCERCGAVREDVWTPQGGRVSSRVKSYPAGYVLKGVGRGRTELVRQEVLSRAAVFTSEQEMMAALFSPAKGRRR